MEDNIEIQTPSHTHIQEVLPPSLPTLYPFQADLFPEHLSPNNISPWAERPLSSHPPSLADKVAPRWREREPAGVFLRVKTSRATAGSLGESPPPLLTLPNGSVPSCLKAAISAPSRACGRSHATWPDTKRLGTRPTANTVAACAARSSTSTSIWPCIDGPTSATRRTGARTGPVPFSTPTRPPWPATGPKTTRERRRCGPAAGSAPSRRHARHHRLSRLRPWSCPCRRQQLRPSHLARPSWSKAVR